MARGKYIRQRYFSVFCKTIFKYYNLFLLWEKIIRKSDFIPSQYKSMGFNEWSHQN